MSVFPKWLPPVLAWALLGYSAMAAVDARHNARELTRELAFQRERESALEDERRALLLEYFTFADFAQVRAAAEKIGMRDPAPEDGSLIFLPPAPEHADDGVNNGGVNNGGGGAGE